MPPASYEPVSDDEDGPVMTVDTVDHVGQEEDAAKGNLRPHTYYNEGPFEAPSSESEDETLLEKGRSSPNAVERGYANGHDTIPRSLRGEKVRRVHLGEFSTM